MHGIGFGRSQGEHCSECGWGSLCYVCTYEIPRARLKELPKYLVSIYPTVRELAKKRLAELI